jgi:hypothetical protein
VGGALMGKATDTFSVFFLTSDSYLCMIIRFFKNNKNIVKTISYMKNAL